MDGGERIRVVARRAGIAFAAMLLLLQPEARAALVGNVAHVLELRAMQRPASGLRMDANRTTEIVLFEHAEAGLLTAPERNALARAVPFARLAQRADPDANTTLLLARLHALLGNDAAALEDLKAAPRRWPSGHAAVLAAVLHERSGAVDADAWRADGDASAAYFLDLARYRVERQETQAVGEALLRALLYARSPAVVYSANYRMALHTMYTLNDAAASLPYFRAADTQRTSARSSSADEIAFRLSYGHALVNAHRSVDALPELDAAAALDPQNPRAHELMGRAQLDSGDPSRARVAYVTSVRLYAASGVPVPVYTYWGLAQTYVALGDARSAREMLRLGLQSTTVPDMTAAMTALMATLDNQRER